MHDVSQITKRMDLPLQLPPRLWCLRSHFSVKAIALHPGIHFFYRS
jgi:hypothetical protein